MRKKKGQQKEQLPDELKLPPSYKQCPDCFEKVPLETKRCPQCNLRLGKIMPDGKAKKPVDWIGYLVSAALITALVLYIRWAFFSD